MPILNPRRSAERLGLQVLPGESARAVIALRATALAREAARAALADDEALRNAIIKDAPNAIELVDRSTPP